MPTKPIQMRIPPETLERLDAAAAARETTRTAIVLEAIEAHLGKKSRPQQAKPEPPAPSSDDDGPDAAMRFRCPVWDCDFEARSATARCPRHNRLSINA